MKWLSSNTGLSAASLKGLDRPGSTRIVDGTSVAVCQQRIAHSIRSNLIRIGLAGR